MRINNSILFWTGMRAGSGVVYKGDDIVVIDSQMRKDQGKLILELMELYGLDPKKLKYLINSHGDPDHIGGNAEILRSTKAKLVTHALEADIIENPSKRQAMGSLFMAAREGAIEGSTVDIKIKGEDEIFKVGELSLRCIHTPGHTPGSMCIYYEESKALFTGDLVLGAGYDCYAVPMVRESVERVIHSLERLDSLDVEWLLPGHGNEIHGARAVKAQINSHIKELNQLPSRVLTVLAEKISTPSEVSEKLLVWPQTIEKIFQDLEKQGKIRKVTEKTPASKEKWEPT